MSTHHWITSKATSLRHSVSIKWHTAQIHNVASLHDTQFKIPAKSSPRNDLLYMIQQLFVTHAGNKATRLFDAMHLQLHCLYRSLLQAMGMRMCRRGPWKIGWLVML
jgi:hypothetical protein